MPDGSTPCPPRLYFSLASARKGGTAAQLRPTFNFLYQR